MIKLFRNIRQKLVDEGKTTDYLKYAIGEIVLVVIGILIALQINSWNSENMDRELETKILKEIQNNLHFDLNEIHTDITYMDSFNIACNYMIDYIKTETSPNEKFFYEAAKLRLAGHFDPNKSGYTLLTSKGVELITNDSLRETISILYETKYPYFLKYEVERIQYRILYTSPKVEHYFTMIPRPELTWKGEFIISQEDFEALKNDQSFIKMLNTVIYENSLIQSRAKSTERYILGLMDLLTEELKQ